MVTEFSQLVQAASSVIGAGAAVGMLLVMLQQRTSETPARPVKVKGSRPQ